jgi:hypothetical protein
VALTATLPLSGRPGAWRWRSRDLLWPVLSKGLSGKPLYGLRHSMLKLISDIFTANEES